MSRARRDLGDFGERVAVAHLEAKGYRIRERNVRTRWRTSSTSGDRVKSMGMMLTPLER